VSGLIPPRVKLTCIVLSEQSLIRMVVTSERLTKWMNSVGTKISCCERVGWAGQEYILYDIIQIASKICRLPLKKFHP
jgi:hypothetical protein